MPRSRERQHHVGYPVCFFSVPPILGETSREDRPMFLSSRTELTSNCPGAKVFIPGAVPYFRVFSSILSAGKRNAGSSATDLDGDSRPGSPRLGAVAPQTQSLGQTLPLKIPIPMRKNDVGFSFAVFLHQLQQGVCVCVRVVLRLCLCGCCRICVCVVVVVVCLVLY